MFGYSPLNGLDLDRPETKITEHHIYIRASRPLPACDPEGGESLLAMDSPTRLGLRPKSSFSAAYLTGIHGIWNHQIDSRELER
jgi:hypothetical protein